MSAYVHETMHLTMTADSMLVYRSYAIARDAGKGDFIYSYFEGSLRGYGAAAV